MFVFQYCKPKKTPLMAKQIKVRTVFFKKTTTKRSKFFKNIKTDGTLESAQLIVNQLKKEKEKCIELIDPVSRKKTVYKLSLSGKNYEKTSVDI